MQCKYIAISKWILLLTISQVSCFSVLQFKNLNEKRVTELLNSVKDTKQHDKDFQNSVSDTVSKHFAGKNVEGSRRSPNHFMYKKLVKRIIPHGYKVKEFEYDDKFKTLFKPLVRIHKVKPDPDDSSDNEDRYDLIYILYDERFEDKTQTNDDDFLKPFTLDNMDIEHLPTDNGVEYFIDRDGKFDDSRPNNEINELGHSKLDTDQTNVQKILSNNFNLYIDDDKLEKNLGTQNSQWTRYDQDPVRSKHIFEFLNNFVKSTINKNKPKTDSEKPHRYFSIGLSSEQFKPEQNNEIQRRRLEKNTAYLYRLKSLINNPNYNNNLDILDLLELIGRNQNKPKENNVVGWFGLVGLMNSKQLAKTDNNNIPPKVSNHEFPFYQPENHNHLPDSSNQIIENKQSIDSKSIQDYIRDLFQSRDNSNHRTHDHPLKTERVPIDIIKPKSPKRKETKPKYRLLNEIDQLKASNDNQSKKRLMATLNILKELRSSQKSGEVDEEQAKQLINLDFIEGSTTAKPNRYHPHIPFWNEWTVSSDLKTYNP